MAHTLDTIQTERLLLRGIDETDSNEIVMWRSDPNVYRYFKSPHKITKEEHLSWYRNSYLNNQNRFDWICIERSTGQKIGVFGLVKDDITAEVNYLLAPDAQHRGYALEGVMALIRYAVQTLKVKQIIAEIHKENKPSVALMKRLDFKIYKEKGAFDFYRIEV
jgi:ribosomal-protein-alanine N-acetyltransferase